MMLDLGARNIQVTYVYRDKLLSFSSNLQLGGGAAAKIVCSVVNKEEAIVVNILWNNSQLWHKIGIDTNTNNANADTYIDTDTNIVTNAHANIYTHTSQSTQSINTPAWKLLTPQVTFKATSR